MGRRTFSPAAAIVLLALAGPAAAAENIDPANAGDQYAWGENIGWLNAEPLGNGGSGIEVQDLKLLGWLWAENKGWISLSCENTGSCATESYGVTNDGSGTLGGYAWGENVGWIRFGPPNAGVTVSPITGEFSGYAWGENVGWIQFASSGAFPFRVKTVWCQGVAGPPGTVGGLAAGKSGANVSLTWAVAPGSGWYDVVQGDLSALRTTLGDFSSATTACVVTKALVASATAGIADPSPGQGTWLLVRAANCKGHGSYDTGAASQAGTRDAEIAASGNDCP